MWIKISALISDELLDWIIKSLFLENLDRYAYITFSSIFLLLAMKYEICGAHLHMELNDGNKSALLNLKKDLRMRNVGKMRDLNIFMFGDVLCFNDPVDHIVGAKHLKIRNKMKKMAYGINLHA